MKNINILLVHGLWHNSQCWNPLLQKFHSSGYKNIQLVDIPSDVDSIDLWSKSVLSFVKPKLKTIIIAHSFAATIVCNALKKITNCKNITVIFINPILLKKDYSFLQAIPKEFASNISKFTNSDTGKSSLPFLIFKKMFVNDNADAKKWYKNYTQNIKLSILEENCVVDNNALLQNADIKIGFIISTEDLSMPNNKNTNYKLGAHIEVQQIKNASHNIMLTDPDKLLKEVLVLIKSLATT